MLTMGSLCDGMGGWCLAAIRHGVRPVWSSEIDKNCLLIEKRHFPNVVQLGDMNLIKELPPVDIVCAGTPCQDLSLAGKREGLDGKRSSLFFRATELVSDMLNRTRGKYPSFLCWENVPGSFSSNRGRDFKRVLEEITQAEIPIPPSGRWAESGMVRSRRCDVSWRCLDAQYWGVPQRRNRIFLVADFRQGGSVAPKYFLSSRACQGILNRSKKWGKALPPILKAVLENQAQSTVSDMTNSMGESQPTSVIH